MGSASRNMYSLYVVRAAKASKSVKIVRSLMRVACPCGGSGGGGPIPAARVSNVTLFTAENTYVPV